MRSPNARNRSFHRRLCVTIAGVCGLAVGVGRGEDPVTWPFDLRTTGQDVHWVSPTGVNPAADQYLLSYRITTVEVTVRYQFLQFTQDVTGEIPPEFLSGSGTFLGPAPILLHEGDLVYPEPPEPPSVSAHVVIGLNAAGHGYIDITNVYLGTAVINVPPFGYVTVQIVAIRVVGSVTAQALNYAAGDLNCDGAVNFEDINPFVLALSDPAGYATAFPACPIRKGDINGDGLVNFDDINPFVALLAGP
ncbi:MAG: hypothetical protein AB1716_13525 [Planctomycetota bacterium]